MRRVASLLLAVVVPALVSVGCSRPSQGSTWNIVEEIEGAEKALAAEPPPGSLGSPLLGLKDEDLPCLKTCHDREKWATGRPYPHLKESHRSNGKHCIDCHVMGHRSAKADRRVCKECH